MRRDYTNKNKRFYDKSQYESKKRIRDKKLKIRTEILIYIFNNLNAFENLMEQLLEADKKYRKFVEKPISSMSSDIDTKSMTYFQIFYNCESRYFYSLFKFRNYVSDFFKDFNYSYFKGLDINKEFENILSMFLIKETFNKNIFIQILLRELKDNIYLKRNYEKFDFDILLELAMENTDILNIASSQNKKEILEILECV